MIELTLTESQAYLVWLALKLAEYNALDNEAVDVVDELAVIQRELEFKRTEQLA